MTNETKPFNLELAIAGHPLTTRDGREAKFIAYVPEAGYSDKLVVLIGSVICTCRDDGKFPNSSFDLELSPLGHCEGKPVFAGDKLICSDNGVPFTIGISNDYFNNYTWPKPERTFSMTESQFIELARDFYNKYYNSALYSDVVAKQVIAEWLDKQEKK